MHVCQNHESRLSAHECLPRNTTVLDLDVPSIESSSISTAVCCCEKLTTAASSSDGVRERVIFSADSKRSSSKINIAVQKLEILGPKVSVCRCMLW